MSGLYAQDVQKYIGGRSFNRSSIAPRLDLPLGTGRKGGRTNPERFELYEALDEEEVVLLRRVMMVLMLALTVPLVGPGLANAGHVPFAGSWEAVDDFDGSFMTLDLTPVGGHAFSVFWFDDGAILCGWDPENPSPGFEVTITGIAGGGRDVLRGVGKAVCGDGSILSPNAPLVFTYDAETDTLTDFFGQVWDRAA